MPKLLVFCGPNGSGKTTVTGKFPIIGTYVNADIIQAHLQCSIADAAINAEQTREFLLANKCDFTFESVLSTPRNIELMKRAKENGYYVVCIYVLTKHPSINIERVHKRVALGEHDVPDDKVFTRYIRALTLFPEIIPICNELYVFDNSNDSSECNQSLILCSINGNVETRPNEIWSKNMLDSLLSGDYPQRYILTE